MTTPKNCRMLNIKTVFICSALLTAVCVFVFISYFCDRASCFASLQKQTSLEELLQINFRNIDKMGKPLQQNDDRSRHPRTSYDDVIDENFQFDINGHDVIVFLHIQKTGGTIFGKHLVKDLQLEQPCVCHRKKKRCDCFRPATSDDTAPWLFSRYSTGWRCGLHADWTELTSCVNEWLVHQDLKSGHDTKRRYFYITMIRRPVERFLSEYRHVQRGATWKGSRHHCGGRDATTEELPKCYSGKKWTGVSLEEFIDCPYNMAHNRQTRMLADLKQVGCYNLSYMEPAKRNHIMLASAKSNLAKMAFFGLTEEQQVTQYVFEETFNMKFMVPFQQYNSTRSRETLQQLSPEQLEEVKKVNELDEELYDFARRLLYLRFNKLRDGDPHFQEHFTHLGEITSNFSWFDIENAP